MINNPRITVAIPVYNVEKYLRRCVDSVLNQTYKNLEVILVDDGSQDGSPTICDEYAHRDSRVTAIHKNNGGQSSARNAALDCLLTGDYVTFIDSDDWIAPDTYEYCVKMLHEYHADSVEFRPVLISTEAPIDITRPENVKLYDGKEIIQFYMYTAVTIGNNSMCNCIFPKEYFEGIRFREGKINEDIDFKYRILSRCKRYAVSNQVKYFYWQSGCSTSTGGLKMADFDLYEAAEELYQLSKDETYGTIAQLGRIKKARTPLSLLCKIAYYGVADKRINRKDAIKKLTKEIRLELRTLLHSPIPLSRKVLAILFAVNYNVAAFSINLGKRFGI